MMDRGGGQRPAMPTKKRRARGDVTHAYKRHTLVHKGGARLVVNVETDAVEVMSDFLTIYIRYV